MEYFNNKVLSLWLKQPLRPFGPRTGGEILSLPILLQLVVERV
jgi:hypothetical protein